MTSFTNSEDLDIKASKFLDLLFVIFTICLNLFFGESSVRNVDVFLEDINGVEQVFVHKFVVGLEFMGFHGEVFIEVEGDDVLERKSFFFVETDELVIKLGRG